MADVPESAETARVRNNHLSGSVAIMFCYMRRILPIIPFLARWTPRENDVLSVEVSSQLIILRARQRAVHGALWRHVDDLVVVENRLEIKHHTLRSVELG